MLTPSAVVIVGIGFLLHLPRLSSIARWCGIPAGDMGLVVIDAIVKLVGIEERAIGSINEDLGGEAGRSVFGPPVACAGKNDGSAEGAKASQYDPVFL